MNSIKTKERPVKEDGPGYVVFDINEFLTRVEKLKQEKEQQKINETK